MISFALRGDLSAPTSTPFLTSPGRLAYRTSLQETPGNQPFWWRNPVARTPWPAGTRSSRTPYRQTRSSVGAIASNRAMGISRPAIVWPCFSRVRLYSSHILPISAWVACGSIKIEWPTEAAHSIAPGEEAAVHTGGCGCWSGLGKTSRSSNENGSHSDAPPSHSEAIVFLAACLL